MLYIWFDISSELHHIASPGNEMYGFSDLLSTIILENDSAAKLYMCTLGNVRVNEGSYMRI